jgi:hypothetical protein
MRLIGKLLKSDDNPWPGWPEQTRPPLDREAQIQALVDGQEPVRPPARSWKVTAEVIEVRSNGQRCP